MIHGTVQSAATLNNLTLTFKACRFRNESAGFCVIKIPYKKIVYIQRDGKNSVIVLLNGKISKVRKSLSQLYSEFESEDFVYIDRGTIVNLAHIMAIRNTMIELKNGICLPASHAKLEETKDKLFTFWGENI